jgi:hypothetical protein
MAIFPVLGFIIALYDYFRNKKAASARDTAFAKKRQRV